MTTNVNSNPNPDATNDRLGDSDWTLDEARSMAADLVTVSSTDDERLGTELLIALIDHLDRLAGRDRLSVGDNLLLYPGDRARATTVIMELRADLEESHSEFASDSMTNTRATIDAGRAVADRLAAAEQSDDWQHNVGRALLGIYALLDELYGGTFTDPLTPGECAEVAAAVGPPQPASALDGYPAWP